MAATAGPYGLRPVELVGGLPFAGAIQTYVLTSNQPSAFFYGAPVAIVNGLPAPITASPTTTIGANTPVGICMGAAYEDPVRGFVNSQYLPANAIANGAKNVQVKVINAPSLIMLIQANGSVTIDKIGKNGALANFVGNTATGNSNIALDAATVAVSATFAVKLYGFPPGKPGSKPGDAFTDVLVIWNAGVHAFQNPTGQ